MMAHITTIFLVVVGLLQGSVAKPNVVFLLADDWGIGDVGAYAKMVNGGDKPPVTPNLDQLASEGTMFTRFHTLASVCSPSRASWLTGSWPLAVKSPYIFSCNHDANVAKGQGDYVNLTTPFIAKVMHDDGYMTAHYGKWHLGCTPDAPPVNAYGYDDSATYVSNNNSAQLGNFSDKWFPANSSTLIVNYALDFVEKALQADKPFYINLWFHISHAPLNPSPEQLQGFDVKDYCPWSGMIPSKVTSNEAYIHCPIQVFRASQHDADQQIGRFMDTIRSKGLSNNTFVIFSGDNGPEDPHVYFNSVGSAGIYRGRKRSLYEGGISTPLIAWLPGTIPAGVVSEEDFASIDFFPTVAAMAGITLDTKTQDWLRGRNAIDLLKSPNTALSPRKYALTWDYRFGMPGKCYHQSPRLAIMDPEGSPSSQLKLLMNPDNTRVELYNLTHDLFEQDNIASSNPSTVARLSKLLLDWLSTMPTTPPKNIVYNEGCTLKGPNVIEVEEDPFDLSLYELA
eukprot:m.58057 g.58057  ORF g.58057 m.58057 type:complete len:510 (-) comp11152_c0_seq2:40-1569(-)